MNQVPESFKTKHEIACELRICVKTLRNKLKRRGIVIPRGLISPEDQKRIYAALGVKDF